MRVWDREKSEVSGTRCAERVSRESRFVVHVRGHDLTPGTVLPCTPAGRQHISFLLHTHLTHAVLALTDLAIVGPKATATVPRFEPGLHVREPPPEGHIISAPGLLATFFEDLPIRRHFLLLLLSATSGAFSFILSLYLYFAILPPFIFVISMFDILAHRLFLGTVQCLCASCLCILCLYSVFFHLLFLFIPPAYFFPLSPCIHPYVLHHPSPSVWRAPYLEGPIHLTEHILSGGLSTHRRVLCLEGCFSVFFVFLSLSCLRGWINFLFATRWSTPFI
jgi:hypothetical protein